jgi:hypothetical protein
MTTADWALLVSCGSLLVAIYSVGVARGAKDQARKAATLAPRTEAILRLRRALNDVTGNHIDHTTLDNILSAKHVAQLVFKQDIIDRIDVSTARRLLCARSLTTQG